MSKTQHTPTPWTYKDRRESYDDAVGPGFYAPGESNPFMWGWDDGSLIGDSEDIEHLISCVNAHDDLVATLREAEAQLAEDFEEAAAINTDQQWVDNITSVLGDVRDLLKRCGEIE